MYADAPVLQSMITCDLSDEPLRSTRQRFCCSTCTQMHQYTCSVYLFFFGITCTATFPLICVGMYTQIHPKKIYLFIFMLLLCLRTNTYLSLQQLVCVPALKGTGVHDPTCSFPYFYSVRLTAKIYPSTFLLLYMTTDISVHQYTCSVFSSFSA